MEKPEFIIRKMRLSDLEAVNEVTMRSWLDTYVNLEHGVTKEWIERFWQDRESGNKEELEWRLKHDKINFLVAEDKNGKVVARSSQIVLPNGVQEIKTLYVDKKFHGTGLADLIMKTMIEWFDSKEPIELGVTSYNERAKRFYRRWNFEEIKGSEKIKFDKLPEIRMIRKGEK